MSGPLTIVVPLRDPPEESLTLARELLQGVECGEYHEIIAIARRRDGSCDTLWTGNQDLLHMLALISRLEHNIQKRLDRAAGTEVTQ